MTTNGIRKAIKGVFVGLALATATVFQANGCTMGVDNLNSVAGVLNSALSSGDFAFSYSPNGGSASATTGHSTNGSNVSSSDWGWDF